MSRVDTLIAKNRRALHDYEILETYVGDLPVVGQALFRQHPLVYLTMVLVLLMVWFLYRTRAGLVLRSVG